MFSLLKNHLLLFLLLILLLSPQNVTVTVLLPDQMPVTVTTVTAPFHEEEQCEASSMCVKRVGKCLQGRVICPFKRLVLVVTRPGYRYEMCAPRRDRDIDLPESESESAYGDGMGCCPILQSRSLS
jgi:hypothetical protein